MDRSYRAVVVDVVDGDTVKLAVRLRRSRSRARDLGFHVYVENGYLVVHDSFRLWGLNAPEHGTVAGDASTAWLQQRLPVGTAVTVVTRQTRSGDEREKYGRWLARIFQGGRSVNLDLLETGHALTWDGHGARPV